MRNVTELSVSRYLLLGMLQLGAVLGVGCKGQIGPNDNTGMTAPACTSPSDPKLVVASQRILRLTMNETVNTVRYLIDSTEAQNLLTNAIVGDDAIASQRLFPPLQNFTIIGDQYKELANVAQDVGNYVSAHYATLTQALAGCTDVSDTCANNYLNKLAAKAYRRTLTSAEQTRFTALYTKLKSQTVNGYQITSTVQEATGYAVSALLSSPQLLWRWEIGGNPVSASGSGPAGIPLTDTELATHLAFFLTDQPPDDMLLNAANTGSLRGNLSQQVDRILGTQAAKDWLRTIVETYYLINQLAKAPEDPAVFSIFTPALIADMQTEADKFLDNALWQGQLTDVINGRTAFLNAGLAQNIYNVPVPNGATTTNFVQTMLPSDQRAGILTNAAFVTSRGRSDGKYLVVPRGKAIASTILCLPPQPPPDGISSQVAAAKAAFESETSQQQVAFRAMQPLCNSCHGQFDAYGLLLENYDTLGRWRTADDTGAPPDSHATLPDILGGGVAQNAIDLADTLAASPAYTNCVARTVLQYAMVDFSAGVDLPIAGTMNGGAASDVVARYQKSGSGTFTDLVRATTASPAFVLRQPAQ